MRDWLKNNALDIALGALGSASVIAAFCNDLYTVVSAGPLVFWAWSAGVALLFAVLAWTIRGVMVKRMLGMTIEEAASRLGARINAHSFEGLSDQCKHLLLFAYGQESGFKRPTNEETFPEGDNCLSTLQARSLLVKMPKPDAMFAAQSWAMSRDARKLLDSDEKLRMGLEEGRARNREAAAKRRERRLLRSWELASTIHKLVVLSEMATNDSETHDGFNTRPDDELGSSQLVEEYRLDGEYYYELQDGVAELFEAHPELYDEFGEKAKDVDWLFSEMVSIYNDQHASSR